MNLLLRKPFTWSVFYLAVTRLFLSLGQPFPFKKNRWTDSLIEREIVWKWLPHITHRRDYCEIFRVKQVEVETVKGIQKGIGKKEEKLNKCFWAQSKLDLLECREST